MSASRGLLRHHLLDLLIDGPSSFAALFSALVRHYDYSETEIDSVLDALREMEESGWVRSRQMSELGAFRDPTEEDRAKAREAYRAWLPSAIGENLSLDEVGLWYEIEFKGRREWERWSKDGGDECHRRWVLDDLVHFQTISIQAESVKVAEEALLGWLSSNPTIELIGESKTVEILPEFEMRDRTVVSDGVRLVCRYRRRPSPTPTNSTSG
jgi:hypothetical protein